MPTETLMMKVSKNTWYGNIPTDWVINKYKFISYKKIVTY